MKFMQIQSHEETRARDIVILLHLSIMIQVQFIGTRCAVFPAIYDTATRFSGSITIPFTAVSKEADLSISDVSSRGMNSTIFASRA